jgi:Domain of unknown function (DUF4157)
MFASPTAKAQSRATSSAAINRTPGDSGVRALPAFDALRGPSGEFSKIPVFSAGRLQAKLKVGAVDDPLEHEADRVADQVMRTPAPVQTKRIGPEGSGQIAAPPIVQEVLASRGQPLDMAIRAFVEPCFGRDFSDVRIHADAKAAKSAHAVNALAYTVGHHIAFGAGQYEPGTESGRKLMVHELTHVTQQATAGSRSATRLLQRRVIGVAGHASDIEFTVGKEIPVALAKKAKAAAAGGITPVQLGNLREVALADGTVSDDERMFLAGLLEADNAAAVAAMTATPGSAVTFSVPSIRPHMDQVKDIGRATPDPEVTKELKAAYDEYFDNFNPHMRAARDAAIKQIHKLAGPAWRKQADAVIALSTLWAGETLVAMIAAASDSTPGDMVMAGAVYAIAAQASHPLVADLKAGRIKVDQLPGSAKGGEFAYYKSDGGGEKGDTIYLYSDFDVNNLAHRRAVIHELEHALDDKSTTARHWRPSKHDDAEVRAYRAGSRYTLERLAVLQDRVKSAARMGEDKERQAATKALEKAIGELAAQFHPIHLIGLALEAHRNLPLYQMLVVSVNAAAPAAQQMEGMRLAKLLSDPVDVVEAELRDRIQDELELKKPDGTIDPVKNRGRFDALSGESVLDTIDLPRQ